MKKIHLLACCGFGDVLSFIARIPNIKEKYQDYDFHFYLGGMPRSCEISKEQLIREGYKTTIIKNFNYHGQIANITELIKKNFVKEEDLFFDISFVDEIFNNLIPVFGAYDIKIPYEYKTNSKLSIDLKTDKKIIAIKGTTRFGNLAEKFEGDVKKGRFWENNKWEKLLDLFYQNNYVCLFVGLQNENEELIKYCKQKQYEFLDYMNLSVADTVEILKYADANISTNSWEWEITSRSCIPTMSLFISNQFFIANHVPNIVGGFYNTCFIETEREVFPEQVFSALNYMVINKKKPEVKYDVAMVTYRDEETIQKTLDNLLLSEAENIIIVYGDVAEQKDRTKEIILSFQQKDNRIKYYEKQWEHDFSIQKNYALSLCKNKWKILLDADEFLDKYTLGMLPWLLWRAEQEGVDCYALSRINIIDDLRGEELQQFCQQQGWQLAGPFSNWIQFPDFQRRIFGNEIKYTGKTHEIPIGFKKEKLLIAHPIHHHKTKERQLIGLEREHAQYKMKAEEVYKSIYGI